MNYIINPMWFYWINVIGRFHGILHTVCFLLFAFIICIMFLAAIHYDVGRGRGDDDEDLHIARALTKVIVILSVTLSVFAIALIFIPSKNTMIEMQIAKFATYENAEWTLDTIKSAVDYIVEAIGAIK